MKNVLLIVDDMPEVARSLRRCLAKSFDEVLVAHSPEEAEGLLGNPDNPPSHLVCDHFLGEGKPAGAELIPRWRAIYPHIRVAVLLTGSELEPLERPEGIDRIVSKPLDVQKLKQFLLQEGSAIPC